MTAEEFQKALESEAMTVKELIKSLESLPPDAAVGYLWDGAVRSYVESVWLARSGTVVLAPNDESVYYDEDRPANAPDKETNPFWPIPAGDSP